jgi:hypothetical protein
MEKLALRKDRGGTGAPAWIHPFAAAEWTAPTRGSLVRDAAEKALVTGRVKVKGIAQLPWIAEVWWVVSKEIKGQKANHGPLHWAIHLNFSSLPSLRGILMHQDLLVGAKPRHLCQG